MKKFLCLFFLYFLFGLSCDLSYAKNIEGDFFNNKELLSDLAFSEKQMFSKTYGFDKMVDRLERLEIAVFGAIQNGREDFRIKKIRKSVTNVASGGNGLNSPLKVFNLAGNSLGTNNWAIGNMHNFSTYREQNNYQPSSSTYYSHRLPPHQYRSHRLPPPPIPRYGYNSNPITNGDYSKNYSIGTSVKILDD